MRKPSRRQFLKSAGTGSGALVAGATVAGVPLGGAALFAQQRWDQEVDVVVVGTGAAGACAALFAHEAGAKVLVLEKATMFGGTTARSGGAMWAPNNALMRSKGYTDPREDCLRYMARCAYPYLYNEKDPHLGLSAADHALLEAYYDSAAPTADGLIKMGVFPSWSFFGEEKDGTPIVTDHWAQLPQDKAPRGRSLLPTRPDGTRGNGGTWAVATQAALKTRNVSVLLDHAVTRLLINGRREVVGVEAATGGRKLTIRARRGVIFGSGGFTQNPEMCRNFLRGPVFGGCAVPTNQGDFVRMGIEAGAKLGNMQSAWWNPVLLETALQTRSSANISGQPGGDSMLTVNRFGRRCVDEKYVWSGRGESHFAWDPATGTYPNMVQFGIYDQFTRERFGGPGGPVPKPGVESPVVITGQTLEGLAAAIGARLATVADRTGGYRLDERFVDNLKETIERFNRFAETGKDLDFRRGESPMEQAERRPGNDKPNPTMYPLSAKGPYYAVMIAPGTLDTNGGPRVNPNAQVVDVNDKPIPGLYGAGNCIASPAAQAYWGHGGTIGPASIYGAIAGKHAAASAVKEPVDVSARAV